MQDVVDDGGMGGNEGQVQVTQPRLMSVSHERGGAKLITSHTKAIPYMPAHSTHIQHTRTCTTYRSSTEHM